MMAWNYIIILSSLLGLVFLIWKETVRVNKLRLTGRLLASVIAVAGVAFMALPWTVKVAGKTATSRRQAILLTDGYRPDSVKLFLKHAANDVILYTSDKSLLKNDLPGIIRFLPGAAFFADSLKNYDALHVFGYGFTKQEAEQLRGLPIVFHPSVMPPGVQSVYWPRHLESGQALVIQGNFYNNGSAPVTLFLNGLHTNLDSTIITPGDCQRFQLTTVPKNNGRSVYSLVAMLGRDTLETEAIPFEADFIKSIKVLMLAASPGFENKFLKNWLFKNSYPIVSRTTISRNKYEKEYLNGNEIKFNSITNSLLNKFDIIISDADELAALSAPELAAIRTHIEQGALGLIVKADSFSTPRAFYSKPFPLYYGGGDSSKQVFLHWQSPVLVSQKLANNNAGLIKKQPGTQPLIFDQASGIYASASLIGFGRLVATTLNNTFSWQLAGYDTAYHSLWTMLIEKAAPANQRTESLSIEPYLPRVNEPVLLTLQAGAATAPQITLAESNVYFEQNVHIPTEWQGKFWPVRTGWQSVTGMMDNSFYVFKASDWKIMQSLQKYYDTKNYSGHNFTLKKSRAINEAGARVPLPKIYFFLSILVSCGYLWWEKKYRDV
jgi:hypothetical protein